MQARILNHSEENLWSEFVEKHPFGSIHQTPQWGHFRSQGVVPLGVSGQAKVPGRGKYWIIVLEEKLTGAGQAEHDSASEQVSTPNLHTKIIAGTLLIRHQLPKGYCWLYAPRGPLLDYNNHQLAQEQMDVLLSAIQKIAKEEKAIFLRVDPLIEIPQLCTHVVHTDSPLSAHKPLPPPSMHFPNFRQNIHGFQPDHTLILNLEPSEQELLAQMKPKGRYNIKLAEKKGVKIRQADPSNPEKFQQDLAAFHKIITETTSRDGFHGHDLEFYKNMLITLAPNARDAKAPCRAGCAALYLAEYENQIIAAALNTYYKDTATYYYGASSNTNRNVMAPYLLHWQAIKEAKADNYKFYDFFGIAPEDPSTQTHSPIHPWAGVTEFKKKFVSTSGTEVSYQLPQELPFKKSLYALYRAYKKLRS